MAKQHLSFHGRFKTKADAKKKEKEVDKSFIFEKDGYFYVAVEKGKPKRKHENKLHHRRRSSSRSLFLL